MEWVDILTKFFELVLFPLLGGLTTYAIILIRNKAIEIAAKTDDIIK